MGRAQELGKAAPRRQETLGAIADGLLAMLGSVEQDATPEALACLCNATGVDVALVFEQASTDGRPEPRLRHRWPTESGTSALDPSAIAGLLVRLAVVSEASPPLGAFTCIRAGSEAPDLLRSEGIETLTAVPIVVGDRCCGHLVLLDQSHERQWDLEVLSAVTAVAAAIGAEQIRRRQRDVLGRQAARLRALYDITSRRSRDVPGQIRRVLALAASEVGLESAIVTRHDPSDPGASDVLHAYSPHPDLAVGRRVGFGPDFLACRDEPDAPKLWPDCGHRDPAAEQLGIGAYVAVRLQVDGQPFGALTISTAGERTAPWATADLEFVRLVANWIETTVEQQVGEARRASTQRQVERSQRLQSLCVALGGIAHDFNNLLMVTSTGLSLADDAITRDEATLVPHLLHNARQATDRAATLTMQLLTFAGRLDLVFAPTDVPGILREHVATLRAGLESEVVLDLSRDPRLRRVTTDETALLEVVSNLVLNASEADPGSVPIAVRLSAVELDAPPLAYFVADGAGPGVYCCVEVEDAGRGMGEETLRRAFEPFFTTKFTGRGLGLSEAMGVVRAHRGAIDLESAPERGTRVRVFLPLAQPEPSVRAAAATREPTSARPEQDEHILLVDDVDMLRETLKHALEQHGLEVDVAANGAEGIECLRAAPDRYTAIILDVTMPVMDGKEALGLVRETHPDLPVLLVSGYTEANVGAAVAPGEPTVFLQKPFGVSMLLSALRALRKRRASPADQ